MSEWTVQEWLLLQFAVISFIFAIGFGVALSMSKKRLKRLQNEFKKMTASIGELIATEMRGSEIRFDALLMQTESYLKSQGLTVSWREVDPLEFPDLLPLFLRCSVLELEKDELQMPEGEDSWPRITAAYEDILFQFHRDTQGSSSNTLDLHRQLAEAEQFRDSLIAKVAELESALLDTANAGDPISDQNGQSQSFTPDGSDPGGQIRKAEGFIDEDFVRKNNGVSLLDQHAAMLSNIIDGQKERIRNLQKELKAAMSSQTESVGHSKGDSLKVLEDQNEGLSQSISLLQNKLASKDQELQQLLSQMEQLEQSQGLNDTPEGPIIAVIKAWALAEESLARLEKRALEKARH